MHQQRRYRDIQQILKIRNRLSQKINEEKYDEIFKMLQQTVQVKLTIQTVVICIYRLPST